MRDYSGDMSFFQDQLTRAGISKDEVNMNRFSGLTYPELQSRVDYFIALKKAKEEGKQ